MPSAFSTIGVPIVDSEQEHAAWATRVAEQGEAVPVANGEYRVLSSSAGPQLWGPSIAESASSPSHRTTPEPRFAARG